MPGLILKKQEMTTLLVDDKQVPVTLLKLVPQEVVRYKTSDKDWYQAVVVWVWKKDLKKDKWIKVGYTMMSEFPIDDEFVQANEVGKALDLSLLDQVEKLTIKGRTKGKGFQWVIKKFHWSTGPKTHGSKFHRGVWAIWNRKPRRVMKGKKLPWHLWDDNVTIKKVKIVEKFDLQDEQILAVKWSIPGAYNSYVQVII